MDYVASITIDNVDEMLKEALMLELNKEVALCVDFIMEHITDYTLQRAYDLERKSQCGILSQKIADYATRNFMSIIENRTFLDFEAEKLQAIIESDQLNIRCEKDAFNVVKQWYEHDASARKQKLPDLIACLRLTQFDNSFLIANIYSLPGCKSLAKNAVTWRTQPPSRCQTILKYTQKRKGQSMTSEEKLLMAFNLKSGTIFQYNKTNDLWQKWGDIKLEVSDFRAILMNECLIITGGERGGQVTNEVCSWSLKTKTFQQWPAMNEARKSHSMIILNENIYLIGGVKGDEILGSVEMYSSPQGWTPVDVMTTPRYWHCAVALNNKIFVMGGANLYDLLSVECYDPITNSWTQCADMNQYHYRTGATVHNGCIFILGGWGALSQSMERYDPQDNWTEICSLSDGGWEIAPITYENQLWAVGGTNSRNVSVYDERNNEWVKKREIPANGPYFCFVVPKDLLETE